jgi:membrane protein implicated in regulation of membrane protease activity
VLFSLAIIAIASGFLAARRGLPWWLPLVAPAGIAIVFYVLWRQELHSDGGDPQPGLIRGEGIGLVVLSLVAIVVGWSRRLDRKPEDE